tara:strand:- start:48 stop:170 length:123 start_codon:yes stop_codon:yes gene_type:complete
MKAFSENTKEYINKLIFLYNANKNGMSYEQALEAYKNQSN